MMMHPSIVFFALLASSYVMFRRSFYEHAIVRFAFSWYYLALWIYPDIPVEVSRIVVRTMLVLLASLEVISYIAIQHYKRKNRGVNR